MGTIYIFGAIQALFFAILIITKKDKKLADNYLTIFFLIVSLFLTYAFSNTKDIYKTYPEIIFIIILVPLCYGMFLFFYVDTLISGDLNKRKYKYHFIPVLINYLILLPLAFKSKDYKLLYFTDRFMNLPVYISIAVILQYISALVYFPWIIAIINKHLKNIKNKYSNIESINLKWLRNLVIGAITLWLMEISLIYIANYTLYPVPYDYSMFIKSSFTIFIFLIGFYGLKQGEIFVQNTNSEMLKKSFANESLIKYPESKEYKEKPMDDKRAQQVKLKLINYITKNKPYLNSELKFIDIAVDLDIPLHIVSYVLNEKLNQTYYDFINSYRVIEAKEKLLQNKNKKYTILSIAYDCGFNSKSSFNRIFKKNTGTTPSVYQKMN